MNFIDAFNQSGVIAKMSLLVGFAPLGLAVAYVLRPSERTLAFMRPVSLAAIFAAICGMVAGWIASLMGVAATLPRPMNMANVYMGLAEALVPALVNFGLLSSAWLIVAIGMVRRPHLELDAVPLQARTSAAPDARFDNGHEPDRSSRQ